MIRFKNLINWNVQSYKQEVYLVCTFHTTLLTW